VLPGKSTPITTLLGLLRRIASATLDMTLDMTRQCAHFKHLSVLLQCRNRKIGLSKEFSEQNELSKYLY